MRYLKFIIAIFIMLFIVVLIVQNHEAMSTSVSFKLDLLSIHTMTPGISLYYIIPISFIFGVLITWLYGMIERFNLIKQIKSLEAASQEKDKELNSLRNLPITSDDVGSSDQDEV